MTYDGGYGQALLGTIACFSLIYLGDIAVFWTRQQEISLATTQLGGSQFVLPPSLVVARLSHLAAVYPWDRVLRLGEQYQKNGHQ